MSIVHKILPQESTYDFIGKRFYGLVFSIILVLTSIGSIATQSMNFGIDFAGGILIEARFEKPAELGRLRADLNDLNLGDVAIQGVGDLPNDVMIRVQKQDGGEQAQQKALEAVQGVLAKDTVTIRRTELVGPKVGGELVEKGILAVSLAILAISVYIWLRFEWQFAMGAMIALIHDVLVTIGIFSLFQIEFTLTTVAAILTVAGYSINDTVVVFDRVREKLRRYKKKELPELLNMALNKTLSRTILTSFTTLLAVIAIFVFGGEVLRSFSFALIFGVTIGTFSSIFVAVPMLIYFGYERNDSDELEDRFKNAEKADSK
jgi:preprotein translocase subunit SecF